MRKCKKIRKCARGVYAPGKFEKRKSSRPENRQGSISIGPGKFARGVKCAPAPPANPAPSGPARKRRPRPRIAGPDATRPAQERPALPALPEISTRDSTGPRTPREETPRPEALPPRVHAGRPAGDQHQTPRTPGRSTSQGSTSPGPVSLPRSERPTSPYGQTDSFPGAQIY